MLFVALAVWLVLCGLAPNSALAEKNSPRAKSGVACSWEPLVETNNRLNSGSSPLLVSIRKQGNASTKPARKHAIVARGSELLEQLGVSPRLVSDLRAAEAELLPLGTQVLRRKPTDEERGFLEGRGAYQPVRIDGMPVTIYTKGTGSPLSLNPGRFPAFPRSARIDSLFFDRPGARNRHPRVVGTETVTWGALELVNSSIIFDYVARKYGLSNLQQAISSGVTIPIAVHHFPELTSFINRHIDEAQKDAADPVEASAIDYRGNRLGLGTVQLIVPTNERNLRNQLDRDDSAANVATLWRDPTTARRVGETLRTLLEAGFVYSDRSSHSQNIYRRGLMAQADNSDMVFLGDSRPSLEAPGTLRERGSLAVAKQILFSRLLLPPAHPSSETLSWTELKGIQSTFWNAFLNEALADAEVRKRVTEKLPFLMTLHPTATSLALGELLYDQAERAHGKRWKEVASLRRQFLSSFSSFGVEEEYRNKLEDNLPRKDLAAVAAAKSRYPVEGIGHFLKTGDWRSLERNPTLEPRLRVLSEIEKLKSETARTDTLNRLAKFLAKESSLDAALAESDEEREASALRRVSGLLRKSKVEEANAALEILGLFSRANDGRELAFHGRSIPGYAHYTQAVIEGKESLLPLRDPARYHAAARKLVGMAASFDTLWERTRGRASALPPVARVALAMLSARTDPKEQADITAWARGYEEAWARVRRDRLKTASAERIFDDMDGTLRRYPELRALHELAMATFLRGRGELAASRDYASSLRDLIAPPNGSRSALTRAWKTLGLGDSVVTPAGGRPLRRGGDPKEEDEDDFDDELGGIDSVGEL